MATVSQFWAIPYVCRSIKYLIWFVQNRGTKAASRVLDKRTLYAILRMDEYDVSEETMGDYSSCTKF